MLFDCPVQWGWQSKKIGVIHSVFQKSPFWPFFLLSWTCEANLIHQGCWNLSRPKGQESWGKQFWWHFRKSKGKGQLPRCFTGSNNPIHSATDPQLPRKTIPADNIDLYISWIMIFPKIFWPLIIHQLKPVKQNRQLARRCLKRKKDILEGN